MKKSQKSKNYFKIYLENVNALGLFYPCFWPRYYNIFWRKNNIDFKHNRDKIDVGIRMNLTLRGT